MKRQITGRRPQIYDLYDKEGNLIMTGTRFKISEYTGEALPTVGKYLEQYEHRKYTMVVNDELSTPKYKVYRCGQLLAEGTVYEIADELNVQPQTVYLWARPSYHAKYDEKSTQKIAFEVTE